MFYNHTVLTSREHGVAVVWLIATLGSKTSSKKVTRKKILEVDVQKACDTIRSTEAPFALRLQGSLLYGVTRVHAQQCRYVLADVTAMRDKIKGVAAFLKDFGLDPQAGKAKPDQLNLPYDPAFMAQLDLDMDLSALGSASQSSRRSSLVSPHLLSSSHSSFLGDEAAIEQPGLELPSNASIGGLQMGFDMATSFSQGYRSVGRGAAGSDLGDGESHIQDPGWEVDEHDSVRETGGSVLQREQRLYLDPNPFSDAEGIIGLTSPQEGPASHRGSSIVGVPPPLYQPDGSHQLEDGLLDLNEDDLNLSDAPHSLQDPAQAGDDHAPISSDAEIVEEQSSSTSASAPQRRARQPKTIDFDARTDLPNNALEQWRVEYLANMDKAAAAKLPLKSFHQAKKNAAHWMLGQGIGGVGAESPLHLFCGDALFASLRAESTPVAGKKRARRLSASSSSQGEGRRVRAREDAGDVIGDDAVMNGGPGDQDDGIVDDGIADGVDAGVDDMEIEIAREEVTEMPPSASTHPWNVHSASRQTSVFRLGSAAGGIPSSVSRPASRITAASPLEGRGLPLSHRISILNTPDATRGLESDHGHLVNLGVGEPSSEDGADFQLPAPAFMDDDNSPTTKQTMAAALDSDAKNFLDMLDDRIQEQSQLDEMMSDGAVATGAPASRSVTFAGLLPPKECRADTAAAAFLHVLCLATKSLVSVRQEDPDFGDIELAITVGV